MTARQIDELPLHVLQYVLALALEGFCVDLCARSTGVCAPALQQLASVSRSWNVAMRGVLNAHRATTHAFKFERYATQYIVHTPDALGKQRKQEGGAAEPATTIATTAMPAPAPSSLLAKSVASFFSSIVNKFHSQHAFPWEEGDIATAVRPIEIQRTSNIQERQQQQQLAANERDAALEAFLMSELFRLKTSLQSTSSLSSHKNPAKLYELRLSESDLGFSINGKHEESLQDWDELQSEWHSVFSMCMNLQRLDLSNISLLSVHIPAILIAASTHCKELKVLVLPQQECLGYKRRNVKPVFDALYAALGNWHSSSAPPATAAATISSSPFSFQKTQHRQRELRRLVMPKLFAYEFYDEHMATIARYCPLLEHVEGLRLAPIFQARGLSHHQVMNSWIHAWELFCDSCLHLREWNWFEIPFVDEFFAIFAARPKLHIDKLTLPGNTTLWKRDYVYQEHQEPANCVCTPDGMKTILQACPNVTTLEILFSDRHLMFGNENPFLIGDEFIFEVICACPQVETLRLTEAQARHGFEKTNMISESGISALAKLENLQFVELSGVNFSAGALFALATKSHRQDSEMPRRRVRATVGVRGVRKIDIVPRFNAILTELLETLLREMKSSTMPHFVIEMQIDTANYQLPVQWAAPFRRNWSQLKQQLVAQSDSSAINSQFLFSLGDPESSSSSHKPTPRPTDSLPFLYDTFAILKHGKDIHTWVARQNELRGGCTWRLQIPGDVETVVVNTPELIEDILVMHFENFGKGELVADNFRDLLGEGIFAVDGLKWLHQRKTASDLLSNRELRDSMEATVRQQPIDVFRLFNRFTFEVFAEIGFGVKRGALEEDEDNSGVLSDQPFQSAFDDAQRMIANRFMVPRRFWKGQRYLNVGGEEQFKTCVKLIDDVVFDITSQSMKSREKLSSQNTLKLPPGSSHLSGRKDIVSLFLDYVGNDTKPDVDTEFDPKLLRDTNPSAEQKIREELVAQVPGTGSGEMPSPSMDQLHQLVYLEATIKETLRLYPSVPDNGKTALRDTVLCDGTFVKAGWEVGTPGYSLGRITHVWGPDAKEYKPERWIDSETGKLTPVSAFKFNAFHAGPRMCLGMNLAMMEMKTVAAVLLSKFRFELVPGQEITYDLSITLPIKGALMMNVTPNVPSSS